MNLDILLVEDDPMLRMLYGRALRRAGHRVHTEERGDAGLSFALMTALDLVILDWHLPGLNGYQILTKLREVGQRVSVMMLSGSGTQAREKAVQAGVDAFLDKPCGLEDVVSTVARFARQEVPAGAV